MNRSRRVLATLLRAACALAPGAAAAEEAGVQPEPYVDRVIDGPVLPPDVITEEAYDAAGSARSLRVELRALSSSSGQVRQSSDWLSVRATMETTNLGSLSLDASARLLAGAGRAGGPGLSFSLYQADMPFAGGWYASQALGVIQTLSPRLAAAQPAILVPTRIVRGAATQWRNESGGITLQLAAGQTGSYAAGGQGGFRSSGDTVAGAGLQLQHGADSLMPPGWAYSAWLASASGSTATSEPTPVGWLHTGEPGGSGLMQSLRWEPADRPLSAQFNLLASRSEAPAEPGTASRAAAWMDGTWSDGPVVHRWGAHRLGPGLSWQGAALSSNSMGGYYRWSQAGLRTQLEAQASSTRPVSAAPGQHGLDQAGVFVRHYIDQRTSAGGTLQFSRTDLWSVQLSGYAELRQPWADLRLQAGIESTSGIGMSGLRLASDQSWATPPGLRATTSQALSSNRRGGASGSSAGSATQMLELAAAGSADATEQLVLDLNARASLPLSSGGQRIFSLSASGQWKLRRGWSLSLSAATSRAAAATTPAADPIPSLPSAFTTPYAAATTSRDFWLTLRHEFQAGSTLAPIGAGGRPGVGSGEISGVVYLDENGNGRRDALEPPAANVVVVLDGRYSARTDTQGRFSFSFVAAGRHTLAASSDTLPLPWSVPPEPAGIEVRPRETIRPEIGATRDRAGS